MADARIALTLRITSSDTIPLPAWPWSVWRPWRRRRCPQCPARFGTGRAYRGHYALIHILGLR